jgi:hypothetical protein
MRRGSEGDVMGNGYTIEKRVPALVPQLVPQPVPDGLVTSDRGERLPSDK